MCRVFSVRYMGVALSAMAIGATPPDPDAVATADDFGLSLSAADPMQDILGSLKRSTPHNADAKRSAEQPGQEQNMLDVDAAIAMAAASANHQISPDALAAAMAMRDDENDPLL